MDINMPHMNGFEATRIIMETTPVPIIIVTGNENIQEVATSFQALEAGAITLLPRPPGINSPEFVGGARSLLEAVKTYAEVKVVRRYPQRGDSSVTQTSLKAPLKVAPPRDQVQIVAIGASTGGPVVIQTLLSGLKSGFPLPVLIVQHMTQGFVQGFAEWLQTTCRFPVHVATHGERVLPGHAYIAPNECQMGISGDTCIVLSNDPPENGIRPSVSFLFRSVLRYYRGGAVAILLTGMGRDGADELKRLKDNGVTTIVQDEESSVIYGMPGEAVKLGAATYVLSPEKIVDVLNEIAGRAKK